MTDQESVFDDEEKDPWADYESGPPLCRCWGQLGDCDNKCASCGHTCNDHYVDTECNVEGCNCPGWKS